MNDDPLTRVIERHCALLMDANASLISAGDVAIHAFRELDPEGTSPVLVAASCQNDLRRRAEAALRRFHDESEREIAYVQSDAFEDILRAYYPVERVGLHAYVPRDEMTSAEVEGYVRKLRKEASAKQRHADALEAWNAGRNRQPDRTR